MLKKLAIEQFVIIDKLALDFQQTLTILTGETGAGKSILLDAMGFILGEPSDPESIRAGSNQSVIEATFAPPEGHAVWKFLAEHNLSTPTDKEFLIHRTMTRDGKDDIQLNGKVVDLELLKEIGTYLVEIHGQFANQSLLDPANQLNLLDLSGAFPKEIFTNVSNALHDVHRYTRELEEENLFLSRHRGRELKRIEAIVARFNKIGMKTGFIEEAETEYAKLLTAKETGEAFQSILARLIASDGVVVSLGGANQTLARQKNLESEKMVDLAKFLKTSLDNARFAVEEMGRLAPDYDIDTAPLYRYEEILRVLRELSAETKVKFEDLADLYEDLSTKLARVHNGQEKLKELEDGLHKAKTDYRHHAHILSEKRVIAAQALSNAITAEFAPLKLERAEFKVLVEENPNIAWTEKGFDEVTFTARMNPGMPFSSIADTASGGELARMILALKVVLQRVQTTPTLVFDEVDTGIGGSAAAAVGERIARLAEATQVLVITHSPQVAARGNQHLHISKKTDGVTTTSAVRRLSDEERIDEISRMLAGDTSTVESNAAAKRLIDEATQAASQRRQGAQQQA